MNVGMTVDRNEAFLIAPELVRYTEGEQDLYEKIDATMMSGIRKGQKYLCAIGDQLGMRYVVVKVTRVDSECIQAIDGPVIRVSDGLSTFRVDGCYYMVPIC